MKDRESAAILVVLAGFVLLAWCAVLAFGAVGLGMSIGALIMVLGAVATVEDYVAKELWLRDGRRKASE